MRIGKILSALLLSTLLTACIGSVVEVAVDTTTEVIKAPFAIAGTVIGVTAETAGTVTLTLPIVAPNVTVPVIDTKKENDLIIHYVPKDDFTKITNLGEVEVFELKIFKLLTQLSLLLNMHRL